MKNKKKLISILAVVIGVISIAFLAIYKNKDKVIELFDIITGESENYVDENFEFLVDNPSSEVTFDDAIASQKKLKNKYLKEYKEKDYTLAKPYIIINPYEISPQTALVMFKTKSSCEPKVTIKGKNKDDLVVKFENSKDHYIPLYGLYAGYKNEVVIECGKEKNTISVDIEENEDIVDVTIVKNDIGNSNGEFYFGTSSLGWGTIAYDTYGEIRWWIDAGYTKGMTFLQNGHMLLSNSDLGPDVTSTSGVVEIDMLGYIYNVYEIDGGYHHDGYELKNGNLIILTSDMNSDSIADYVIEMDRKTGKVVNDWKLKDIALDVDPDLVEYGEISWGWANSVFYDENSNALIISLRNQNSVVSIDYKTKKINWILGEEKYWTPKFDKYLLKGVGEEFLYPMGEHSVNINKNGNLTIFNNGYNAYRETDMTCASLRDNASYAMEYKINEKEKTAEVVYKFGGSEYFSYALSSYTPTLNNHMVFNSGWHFTDKTNFESSECTQYTNDQYDAHIIEFNESNEIVFDMIVDESKFEVVKAPIYNLEAVSVNPKINKVISNYDFKDGIYLSTQDADNYIEISYDEAAMLKDANTFFIDFTLYSGRFTYYGIIPDSEEVNFIFVNTKGKAYKYNWKEKDKTTKRKFINILNLPKGRYYIFMEYGEKMYNTSEYVVIK